MQQIIIEDFDKHSVMTYIVDFNRRIHMVNYCENNTPLGNKWISKERYSTIIEFIAEERRAIITSHGCHFVYQGELALFKELENEMLPYMDIPDILTKHSIAGKFGLTKEDILVFSSSIKKYFEKPDEE